jgi:hypothetical protein
MCFHWSCIPCYSPAELLREQNVQESDRRGDPTASDAKAPCQDHATGFHTKAEQKADRYRSGAAAPPSAGRPIAKQEELMDTHGMDISSAALQKYAELSSNPPSATQIRALAALFRWSPPEGLEEQGAALFT